MPLMNGLEAARALKSTMPQVPLLMFTNNAGAAADEARQAGIFAMVSKSDANSSQQLVAYAKLELHPHVHCVVAAGGLSLDRTHWIQPRYPFFLSVKVLSRVFRGKFVFALKRNFRQGKLGFYGNLKPLAHPKAFSAWIRTLFRKRLARLLQTSLRRSRACALLFRPLHPSRRHLQPPTRLLGRRPSHLSLARFRSPQRTQVDDSGAR